VAGRTSNPVVSLTDWWLGRRARTGLIPAELVGYAAQTAGAVLTNLMFELPAVAWSPTHRNGGHLWLAEVVCHQRPGAVHRRAGALRPVRVALVAVGAYIGAAYWFTSSTSFANPPSRSGGRLPTRSLPSRPTPCWDSSAPNCSAACSRSAVAL
jgi:hypothetical protein